MFALRESAIQGCYEIQPRVMDDTRGRFVKVFHSGVFSELNLETDFREEYYSVSRKGVIRGFHFQLPPADHAKMVYCVHGQVVDVVIDLRVGSPTYGKSAVFDLSAETATAIYIPKGLAHGFCALTHEAVLVYKVSTVYAPDRDAGILWNSVGIEWPTVEPILSDRDLGFPPLSDFRSPFVYD